MSRRTSSSNVFLSVATWKSLAGFCTDLVDGSDLASACDTWENILDSSKGSLACLFDVVERFLTSIVVLGARLGDIIKGSTSPCKNLLVLLVYCAHEFPSIFLVLSVSQEIASDALKRNDDSFPLRL